MLVCYRYTLQYSEAGTKYTHNQFKRISRFQCRRSFQEKSCVRRVMKYDVPIHTSILHPFPSQLPLVSSSNPPVDDPPTHPILPSSYLTVNEHTPNSIPPDRCDKALGRPNMNAGASRAPSVAIEPDGLAGIIDPCRLDHKVCAHARASAGID